MDITRKMTAKIVLCITHTHMYIHENIHRQTCTHPKTVLQEWGGGTLERLRQENHECEDSLGYVM